MTLYADTRSCLSVFTKTNHYLRYCSHAELTDPPRLLERVKPLSQRWAKEILNLLRVQWEVRGQTDDNPVLLLGSHVSYLDIPLLLSATHTSFVTKEEIKQWPIFGNAARRMDSVFLNRGSKDSRKRVGDAVYEHVCVRKRRLTIFPSGTTCINEEKEWRWGAFRIAAEYDLRVQPFRILYTPARLAAFIGSDSFVPHLFNLVRQNGLRAVLEFHEPVKITHPEKDCRKWQRWAQAASA
ncbi:MAG: lysophospholipid acyltransferase family protein [Bdellovibrionota bacterium]